MSTCCTRLSPSKANLACRVSLSLWPCGQLTTMRASRSLGSASSSIVMESEHESEVWLHSSSSATDRRRAPPPSETSHLAGLARTDVVRLRPAQGSGM